MPDLSVALIVTTVLVADAAKIIPATGSWNFITPVQLSVAVALPVKSGISVVQATGFLYKVVSPKQVITGGVLSTIVTCEVQVDTLPSASVTVSVTMLVVLVLAQVNVVGLTVMVTCEQLSKLPSFTSATVTVAVPFAPMNTVPGLHLAVGFSVSLNSSWKLTVVELPDASTTKNTSTLVPPNPITVVPGAFGGC